jgi:hypothetical protein
MNFALVRPNRAVRHYVRVVKTAKTPHAVLLLFDSCPGEADKYCTIGLVPKDVNSSTAFSRPDAIVGQFQKKCVGSTILSIHALSAVEEKFTQFFLPKKRKF